MPPIRSAKEVAEKWSRVTQGRSSDFAAGVKSPQRSWAKNAAAAEDSYKSGVTAAANAGRYGTGVAAAGDAKWSEKTIKVGVGRWAGGVAVSKADFESGFSKFADVISKTELPPRYPKGDPRNFDRVKVMGEALRAAKVGA